MARAVKQVLKNKSGISATVETIFKWLLVAFSLLALLNFFGAFKTKSDEALELSACKITLTAKDVTTIIRAPGLKISLMPDVCKKTLPVIKKLPSRQARNMQDFERELATIIKKSWDMIGGGSAGDDVWSNAVHIGLFSSSQDYCFPVYYVKLSRTNFFNYAKPLTKLDFIEFLATESSGVKYGCKGSECFEYSFLQYIVEGDGFLFIDLNNDRFVPGETYAIAIFSPKKFKFEKNKFQVDPTVFNIISNQEFEVEKIKMAKVYFKDKSDNEYYGTAIISSSTQDNAKLLQEVQDEIPVKTNGVIITEAYKLRGFCKIKP